MLELEADTFNTTTVVYRPFPTKWQIKEILLTQRLPEEENLDAMYDNLHPTVMSRLLTDLAIDGGEAHHFFMQQQRTYIENQNMAPYLTLTDPFAWSRFLKELKEEREKKRKEKLKKQEGVY